MAIQRYGMAVRLKDEKRQYYIDNHANVWPEVLEELKKINVQNYRKLINYSRHAFFITRDCLR